MTSLGVPRSPFTTVLELGDATRYEFRVEYGQQGSILITKMNGLDFQHTFKSKELDDLTKHAQVVLSAEYDEYQSAALSNRWLAEEFFDKAKGLGHNPWTFLAAGIAAVESRFRGKGAEE